MFQKHTHRRFLLGVEEGANVDDSIRLIGPRMIDARRWSDFDARFQVEAKDVRCLHFGRSFALDDPLIHLKRILDVLPFLEMNASHYVLRDVP